MLHCAVMHVVSCLNLKGGAAKTTTAVNAAGALAELGERVAVLDLDPQQSAVRWEPQGLTVHAIEDKSARAVKAKLEALADDGVTFALLDCPPELEDRSLTAAMLSDLITRADEPEPARLVGCGSCRQHREGRPGGAGRRAARRCARAEPGRGEHRDRSGASSCAREIRRARLATHLAAGRLHGVRHREQVDR